MPFKSEKQRRWMHIHEPALAKQWEHKYGSKPVGGKKMPAGNPGAYMRQGMSRRNAFALAARKANRGRRVGRNPNPGTPRKVGPRDGPHAGKPAFGRPPKGAGVDVKPINRNGPGVDIKPVNKNGFPGTLQAWKGPTAPASSTHKTGKSIGKNPYSLRGMGYYSQGVEPLTKGQGLAYAKKYAQKYLGGAEGKGTQALLNQIMSSQNIFNGANDTKQAYMRWMALRRLVGPGKRYTVNTRTATIPPPASTGASTTE